MTANRNLKRRVRARAAKTGESYTAALRHFRIDRSGDDMPDTGVFRLTVAQTVVRADPRDADGLRSSGAEIRAVMREAKAAGARLVLFCEGATCFPHKRIMSIDGPDRVGPADWDRFRWDVLRSELASIARLAGELGLWTVVGSTHRLTPPHRPHNSMYVLSDQGRIVTRYDERYLSNTKISYMYTPGSEPRTFQVDGVRFGCLLGMESHFAELFAEYERLDVDCVLFATTGAPPDGSATFATEARGHAAANGYWIGFAMAAQESVPSGVIAPDGNWTARCAPNGPGSFVVADLDESPEEIEVAVSKARPWRRTARSGLYENHVVADPRSEDRTVF